MPHSHFSRSRLHAGKTTRPRSGVYFDSMLDLIERRAFRIGMLIVFLLWISDKVWHTAITTDFIAYFTSSSKAMSRDISRPSLPSAPAQPRSSRTRKPSPKKRVRHRVHLLRSLHPDVDCEAVDKQHSGRARNLNPVELDCSVAAASMGHDRATVESKNQTKFRVLV